MRALRSNTLARDTHFSVKTWIFTPPSGQKIWKFFFLDFKTHSTLSWRISEPKVEQEKLHFSALPGLAMNAVSMLVQPNFSHVIHFWGQSGWTKIQTVDSKRYASVHNFKFLMVRLPNPPMRWTVCAQILVLCPWTGGWMDGPQTAVYVRGGLMHIICLTWLPKQKWKLRFRNFIDRSQTFSEFRFLKIKFYRRFVFL